MRLRTPAIVVLAVAVLIVVVTGVTWAILRGQSTAGQAARPMAPTLLLQVVDDAGDATGNVLVSGGPPPAAIIVPRTLLVPVPEPIPVDQTPAEPDTLAARDGISALLGVRIDASLAIDRLALAALVDAAGGAPLEVRDRFVERDAEGNELLAIAPGARVLDGRSAAAYATVAQPGEPVAEQDRRLVEVLGHVLTRLPDDPEPLRQILLSLGSSMQASAGNDAIVATLLDVRGGLVGAGLEPERVPVTTLVDGTSSAVRQPATTDLVRRLLPTALLGPGQSPLPRVRIEPAGVPATGVVDARERLAAEGIAVVSVGEGPEPTADASAVVVPDADGRVVGERVAVALGIPIAVVRVADPGPAPVLDAVIVLAPKTGNGSGSGPGAMVGGIG